MNFFTQAMITRRGLRHLFGVGGITMIATLAALIVGASLSTETLAQGANNCSLKTLKGTWVFQEQGVVKDGQKVVPWAAAGVWIFDGAGKSEGLWSGSMDGEAIASQKPFTATYELKPGCVFRSVDSLGIVYDVYPINQGTTTTYFAPGVSGTMFKR